MVGPGSHDIIPVWSCFRRKRKYKTSAVGQLGHSVVETEGRGTESGHQKRAESHLKNAKIRLKNIEIDWS